MRGKRVIQQVAAAINKEQGSLFPEPKTSLYEEKVKLLIARYYHYNEQQIKYDQILLKLQDEFFISTGRIADIISERVEDVKELRERKPEKKWFATQWAHLIW